MEIVTGHTGAEHITSVDAAMFNIAMFGSGEWGLNTLDKLAYEIISNNRIDIKSGDIMMQGRHGRIAKNTKDQCSIDNGTQGMQRRDMIAVRYRKSGEIESMDTVVIKGAPAASAKDPVLTTGDINAGATLHEMPLYRVTIDGLNITSVTKMFEDYPTLRRVRSGTKLPASGKEGDIFLLRES